MKVTRDLLVGVGKRYELPEPAFERLVLRRDRKRRNNRIAAGIVGIAVFVAAVWIVTSAGSLDRSETSVVPGGDVTGPAVSEPTETAVIGGEDDCQEDCLAKEIPGVSALIGTVTQSRFGCALEIVAEPIPSVSGWLSVVNGTNRWVSFELYRLDSEASFAQFEAFVEAFHVPSDVWPPETIPGALVRHGWFEREVGPGDSGTITHNFATGDAFAVVCLDPHDYDGPHRYYAPFAVVGPIVVP
jgi:hypothetical protein